MTSAMGMDKKLEKINGLAERILEETGIRILSAFYRELLADKGITIEDGKAFFKKEDVRPLLDRAPSSFTLHAVNPANDICIGGGRSKIAPGYGCASVMDPDGNIRDACYRDHVDLIKLVHQTPVLDINGGILAQPSDIPAGQSHLAMTYAALLHTDKCLMGMPGSRDQVADIMALAAIRAGGEEKLKQAPRVLTMISPVSPLQVDRMGMDSILAAGSRNQPLIISPGIAAGSTGPIDLANNVAVATAEALGVMMMVQTLFPGNPVIFGLQCYGSDMRSGGISIGSPAYALQAKYCAALARYYNLPSRAGGAVNDAKSLSPQAGYESMLSMFTAMQNKVSLIVHGAGILDRFAAISFEKFIMDLEMIKMIGFYLDDMTVDEETLNFDLIQEVGPGGLFLTHQDTMKKCRTHTWNPDVALRGSLKGMSPPDKFLQNIRDTREKMLAAYEPPVIAPRVRQQMDAFMREKGVDPHELPLHH